MSDGTGEVVAIDYADNVDGGTVGNDVSLTVVAVPEASSMALLGGAALLAGLRRPRSRRGGYPPRISA